jgi:preprotein translocase subunit SecG
MMFLYYSFIVVYILIAVVLCLLILMQDSKSVGLGASFGGDTTDSVFGTATADILKKSTGWLGVAFFSCCILLSLWTSNIGSGKQVEFKPASIFEEVEVGDQ